MMDLFPPSIFLGSQDVSLEEQLGQMFLAFFPAYPSFPKPSFWCCYLLLQNVELFKKTFNFLCCYSVAIVN